MRLRPITRSVLLASTALSVLVGAAAPSGAAGPDRKIYKASLKSTSSVTADFSGAQLEDYVSGEAWDRLLAVAPRSAPLIIRNAVSDGTQTTCKSGSVQLYGRGIDWSNTPDGVQGGVLQVDCTYPDGSKHRFFWGTEHYGSGWAFRPSSYCLGVTRSSTATTTTYSVTTLQADSSQCPAQEQTLDAAGNVLASTASPDLRPMPFHATFTVNGKVPTATR